MKQPSVGIAIPSFEQHRFVRQSLESVAALTLPFEAIVQDGGSRDGTVAAICEVVGDDPRFEVVVEADRGQSDAINRAWRRLLPSHPFVTWFNTDDILHPFGFERAVELLAGSPDAVAAYGDFQLIDAEGSLIRRVRSPDRISRFELIHTYNVVPGNGVVVRSSALNQVGLLDESLHYTMDYDLWIRLLEVGSLVRAPYLLQSFRSYPGAKSMSEQSAKEMREVSARYRSVPTTIASFLRVMLTPVKRLRRLHQRLSHE